MPARDRLANLEGVTTMSQIKDSRAETDIRPRLDELEPSTGAATALRLADRSCCCSAPPAFTVIFTTKTPPPHSVDLLMCGHHYRRCSPALAVVAALVFDSDGRLVSTATDQSARSQRASCLEASS